ncbi:MAG: hypothetical protein HOY78_15740 [Saccharothrix sp.]|nr:hypothetical protein [Saccharothrix sp.]
MRGPWEVRLVRVDDLSPDRTPTLLRLSGWAVTGSRTDDTGPGTARALGDDGTRSGLTALLGTPTGAGVTVHADASPLGPVAAVPHLHFAVATGTWIAVLVELTRDPAPWSAHPEVELRHDGSTTRVATRWPDGAWTRVEPA